MTAHWSLGVLVGLPFAILGALILTAGIVLFAKWHDDDSYIFAAGCGLALLGLLITCAFVYFPYETQYHRWVPISGAVTDVSSRLIADGRSGTTQRFVVDLRGVGQRSCDDTRCATVKVGDTLSLACKRHWQWAATPGWDCNFVDLKAAS